MEDLASKINEIMSDPEKLKEIQSLGKMMGLTEENTGNKEPAKPAQSQISQVSNNQSSGFTGVDPNIIGKLAPILSSLNKEDDTTRLFDALIPFLSEERKVTLGKIRKMLIVFRLLPHIKDLGLF
jgi:hypothetical protein